MKNIYIIISIIAEIFLKIRKNNDNNRKINRKIWLANPF